jgi:hypothetical protein
MLKLPRKKHSLSDPLLAGFIASGEEERVSKFSTLVSLQ